MASEVDNIIWMIWKNEQKEFFKVGELCKSGGKYYFKYDAEGVKKAEVYGFTLLPQFPRVDAEYFREELFHSFSQRISWNGKRETNSILKEYNLEQFDAFELLKRSGGKIATDSLEFSSPFDEQPVL